MANFKDHLQKMAQPFLVKCILLCTPGMGVN
jgi:hypothetical protein